MLIALLPIAIVAAAVVLCEWLLLCRRRRAATPRRLRDPGLPQEAAGSLELVPMAELMREIDRRNAATVYIFVRPGPQGQDLRMQVMSSSAVSDARNILAAAAACDDWQENARVEF